MTQKNKQRNSDHEDESPQVERIRPKSRDRMSWGEASEKLSRKEREKRDDRERRGHEER